MSDSPGSRAMGVTYLPTDRQRQIELEELRRRLRASLPSQRRSLFCQLFWLLHSCLSSQQKLTQLQSATVRPTTVLS